MQIADRKLLELAAKAAGIDAELHPDPAYDDDGMWLKGARSPDNSKYWNPLARDGDALRLAVKLGLYIEGKFTAHQCVKEFVELGELAAVRRAIVRAAAAIGKEMP